MKMLMMSFGHSSPAPFLVITALLCGLIVQVQCLNISYQTFTREDESQFITTNDSYIAFDAIQVTGDAHGASLVNLSGRIWYKHPFKLWSGKKNITASFNSTFVINITPQTDPGGEGLAFILTEESGSIPENSHGQWLGIVNASTNGSSTKNIFAVEFDTGKSFTEDIDDNHVGVNINSINSIEQVPLSSHGVNLTSASDVIASVQYDGRSKTLKVFVFMGNETGDRIENPIISRYLDLSEHLPEKVFVGFSASTGVNNELNCIRAWNFTSTEINDKPANLLWLWILLSATIVALLGGFSIYFHQRGKVLDEDPNFAQQIQSSGTAPKKYRLRELKRATANFNKKNELGRGGFGIVFKGVIGDKEVAVKRFSNSSNQGRRDFIAEVTTIGNLHHKNLVKLVGWCYESRELLLVYEFMPNGSLDKFIFWEKHRDVPSSILSWQTRHGIICGVASALDYLHNGCEKKVLHRDIKASNIMLDSEFNARLGDFGLARTIQLSEKTHHSTREIAGTPGYMAPETFHVGRATAETDVYAFGVLVLEVVCGRKPGNQQECNNYNNGIVDWVWELYKTERILDAVDVRLDATLEEEIAQCMLELGLACCHPNPNERPSIRTALQVLTGEAAPPAIPREKPAFMWPATSLSLHNSFDYSASGGQVTPITVLSGR